MDNLNKLKILLASVVGALTGLWGWMGWIVLALVVCMVLDYITGTAAAAKAGNWSSGKAREGVWHKVGMVIVVMVAAISDLVIALVLENLPMLELPIEYSGLICPIVMIWYIITELGSIVENAIAMGAPAPAWLAKILAISKDAVDKAGDAFTDGIEGSHPPDGE